MKRKPECFSCTDWSRTKAWMLVSGTFSLFFFFHSTECLPSSVFCSLTCSLCKTWNKILIFHLNPGSHGAAGFILLSLPPEVERAAGTSTASYLSGDRSAHSSWSWQLGEDVLDLLSNVTSFPQPVWFQWPHLRIWEGLRGVGTGTMALVDWTSTAFKPFSQGKIPSFSCVYPLYFLSTRVKLCLDLHMHRSLDWEVIFQAMVNPASMTPCILDGIWGDALNQDRSCPRPLGVTSPACWQPCSLRPGQEALLQTPGTARARAPISPAYILSKIIRREIKADLK